MFISLRGESRKSQKYLIGLLICQHYWKQAQIECRSEEKQGTGRLEEQHGCCWWEWYNTSVWDVVPIKATQELSFSLPLTIPMSLLVNYLWEFWTICFWKQIICCFLFEKNESDFLERCLWWLWKEQRGRWKNIPTFVKKLSNRGLQVKGDDVDHDDDYGEKEVTDNDTGDYARWTFVIDPNCKQSHMLLHVHWKKPEEKCRLKPTLFQQRSYLQFHDT